MSHQQNPAHLLQSAQASYDDWLIQEVKYAREDTRPRITHSEILRRSENRRAELLKHHELMVA
jgi:hypothetical protein